MKPITPYTRQKRTVKRTQFFFIYQGHYILILSSLRVAIFPWAVRHEYFNLGRQTIFPESATNFNFSPRSGLWFTTEWSNYDNMIWIQLPFQEIIIIAHPSFNFKSLPVLMATTDLLPDKHDLTGLFPSTFQFVYNRADISNLGITNVLQ